MVDLSVVLSWVRNLTITPAYASYGCVMDYPLSLTSDGIVVHCCPRYSAQLNFFITRLLRKLDATRLRTGVEA